MDAAVSSLFDAHCHISPGWSAQDGIVPAPRPAAGRMLCSASAADWPNVAAAASLWPGTVAAFGIHPWHAGESGALDAVCGCLPEMLEGDAAAWVGEIGLDGLRTEAADEATQREAFARQLRLAARRGHRVNVHCVRAWEALVRELDREYLAHGGGAFILHAFSGPHPYIEALRRRGAYFTVGPLAWHRGSRRQAERARRLPEERLLVESDAFLLPGRDGGEELRGTLAWLAGVRGMSVPVLAERIGENVRKLLAG